MSTTRKQIGELIASLEKSKALQSQKTADEAKTLQEAKKLQALDEHEKVIELLQPFEQSLDCSLGLLNVLGISYNAASIKNPDLNKKALSLYNFLYRQVKQLNPPDPLVTIDVIISRAGCFGKNPRMRELIIKEALQLADKYKKENPSQEEEIKNTYYEIYFYAAILHTNDIKDILDSAKQLELFEKAKEYYLEALKYKPNDLPCLLNYTRIAATFNVQSAIQILQPYEEKYQNNSSYHFSMQQLYQTTENTALADEYKQKFTQSSKKYGTNKLLISIFNNFYKTTVYNNDSPEKRIRAAEILLMYGDVGNVAKAKIMIESFLKEYPDYVRALQLFAHAESITSNNQEKIIEICDKALKIEPTSIFAKIYKADIFWKRGTDHDLEKANALYERLLEQDYRNTNLISRLIQFNITKKEKLTQILHSLEDTQHLLPEAHFNIAHGYLRLGEYQKALDSFNKLRVLDRYYKHNQTALGIVYSLFQMAATKEDYARCAKKLRSYYARLESDERDSVDEEMLKELKSYFDLPETSTAANQEEKKEEQKPKKTDPIVPADVKAKVLELLKSKNSCIFDKFTKEREDKDSDRSAKLPEKLYPIGDPKNHIFGYIVANTKNSSEKIAAKFQKALENGNQLTSDSEGIAGSKKLENGRWSLKIAGSGKRMLSTRILFKPRSDDPTKDDTVIEYGKVVNHARLNK